MSRKEKTDNVEPMLPGLPQPDPKTIKVRGVTFPLFSQVYKALGKLPAEDVEDLRAQLLEAPQLDVQVK